MASNLEKELAELKLCSETGLYQNRVIPSKQKHLQQPVVSFHVLKVYFSFKTEY